MSDIMDISRLRMGTDGKGIRTLVAFHGCPLACAYCANPHCHDINLLRADYTAEELLQTLRKDAPYFMMTGGGVTFGGGEPLLQAEFIHDVCSKMDSGWNKAIETSLLADWQQIELLLDDIDYWYIDIKDVDGQIYKKYTGRDNCIVLENLKRLVAVIPPEKICVRIPYIPEYNTKEHQLEEIEYIQNEISREIGIDAFEYAKLYYRGMQEYMCEEI